MMKKIRALAAALALSLVLGGCGGFHIEFNPEELYALPELPAKYTELNARLNGPGRRRAAGGPGLLPQGGG